MSDRDAGSAPAQPSSSAEMLFERARALDGLGQTEAARAAYLAVLACDSTHAGALNELGCLLARTGYRTAARSAFARAAALHPHDPVGHGNLANLLFDEGDVGAARAHYEIAVRLDPHNVAANACLAIMHLRDGDTRRARDRAAIGFAGGASAWPFRGERSPVGVLVISSALGGNVVTEYDIDDRTFAKWTLVAEFDQPAVALPAHALIFNAVGDADRCGSALAAAGAIVARSAAPTINPPARVMATGRAQNARRFADLPGVVAPRTKRWPRQALAGPGAAAKLGAAGFGWPLIVRAPGYHTGEHCARVDGPADLARAVADLPGDELLTIAFVDVRRRDGFTRKYRAIIVDGALFPLHLAVSSHWKVHDFTADMTGSPEHVREEAAFLTDLPGSLGAQATRALHAVKDRLGLDYGGIDFALDAAGRVVVFEANATMIVPPARPDEGRSERRAAVDRIRAAVRSMLLTRAGA